MVKPKVIAAENKKISASEAFIFDNNEYISLLIGSKIPQDFAYEVLGTETFSDYAINI